MNRCDAKLADPRRRGANGAAAGLGGTAGVATLWRSRPEVRMIVTDHVEILRGALTEGERHQRTRRFATLEGAPDIPTDRDVGGCDAAPFNGRRVTFGEVSWPSCADRTRADVVQPRLASFFVRVRERRTPWTAADGRRGGGSCGGRRASRLSGFLVGPPSKRRAASPAR